MDADTRRQRHAELWQSGTVGARRVAIGGVIFSILLLLRVVEPYNQLDVERQKETAKLEETRANLALQEADLPGIEQALQDIQDELDEEPWNDEIQSLMDYFVDLRTEGTTGPLPVPQDRANKTIDNIVKLVDERVITKLRNVISESNTSERLADYPNKIEKALQEWRNDHYDQTEWYFTPDSKRKTIDGMAEVLEALKSEALAAVEESKRNIAEQRREIAVDIATIDDKIELLEEDIEDAMYEILPQWAEDSIGVGSMVKLYPWVLLIIAGIVVGKGWTSARHFHGMADMEGWTAAERSDPLASSPWTLTWRGFAGTAVTIVNYASVLLVLVFCLHRAAYPPPYEESESDEQQTEHTAQTVESSVQDVADTVTATVPVEVAYGLLVALLAALIVVPAFKGLALSRGSE